MHLTFISEAVDLQAKQVVGDAHPSQIASQPVIISQRFDDVLKLVPFGHVQAPFERVAVDLQARQVVAVAQP